MFLICSYWDCISGPPGKDGNARFSIVTFKPYSEKNVENIVVFMTQKVFISSSFSFIFLKTRSAQVTFEVKPQIKMKSLKKKKHKKIIHAWSDKVFKSTLVNRVLPSLHGGVFWNYAYSSFNFQNYFKASYLLWMAINLPWGHIEFVLGSAVFTFIAIVNSNQSQQWNGPNELANLYCLTRKSG